MKNLQNLRGNEKSGSKKILKFYYLCVKNYCKIAYYLFHYNYCSKN